MCDKDCASEGPTPGTIALKHVSESIRRQDQEYLKAKQSTQAYSGEASGASQAPANDCSSILYGNARRLIDRLIDYHNRQSNQLHALLRALPQDMSRDAEQALYDFAKTTLGNIR